MIKPLQMMQRGDVKLGHGGPVAAAAAAFGGPPLPSIGGRKGDRRIRVEPPARKR